MYKAKYEYINQDKILININMSNSFNQVKIDNDDPRFQKLREAFTDELKKRFTCESYEPVVE